MVGPDLQSPTSLHDKDADGVDKIDGCMSLPGPILPIVFGGAVSPSEKPRQTLQTARSRFGVDGLHDVIGGKSAALLGRVIVSAALPAPCLLLFAVHLIPDVSPAVRIVFGRLDA